MDEIIDIGELHAATQSYLDKVGDGSVADEYWRERLPMSEVEFDDEIAACVKQIQHFDSLGDKRYADFWREHRRLITDFYAGHRAA